MRGKAQIGGRGAGSSAAAATGAAAVGAGSLGAMAVGALALGALAVGALAIGRLSVGRARFRRLEIDELSVAGLTFGPGGASAFARLRAAPGSGDALERFLRDRLAARDAPGALVRVLRSRADPEAFLICEPVSEGQPRGAGIEALARAAVGNGLVTSDAAVEAELYRDIGSDRYGWLTRPPETGRRTPVVPGAEVGRPFRTRTAR